jgi:hypothetical protein
MSWSIWVKMDDATNFRIFAKDNAAALREYYILTNASDKLAWILFKTDATAYLTHTSTAALTSYEGAWTHVVATYSGSETFAGMILYVNGQVLATTGTLFGTYAWASNTTTPLLLGSLNATTYANGMLYGAKMWNRALTPAEVTELYNQGRN